MKRLLVLLLVLITAPVAYPFQKEEDVLRKMEATGKTLKSLSATIWQQKTNTQIGIQDPPESGNLYYVPAKGGKMRLRIDIAKPAKTIVVNGDEVKFYQPEIRQVLLTSIKSASKNQSVASLAITFGSVAAIRSNYNVAFVKEETLNGEPTVLLLLTPKTQGAYKKIELWVSQKQWMPVQQRLVESNDDVIVIKITNLKPNSQFDAAKLIDSFNPPNVKVVKG
ncbi:MAG: outer membrane lipoprotein carrier protein LolA [Candidatus Bathyarchaeia archaeon]